MNVTAIGWRADPAPVFVPGMRGRRFRITWQRCILLPKTGANGDRQAPPLSHVRCSAGLRSPGRKVKETRWNAGIICRFMVQERVRYPLLVRPFNLRDNRLVFPTEGSQSSTRRHQDCILIFHLVTWPPQRIQGFGFSSIQAWKQRIQWAALRPGQADIGAQVRFLRSRGMKGPTVDSSQYTRILVMFYVQCPTGQSMSIRICKANPRNGWRKDAKLADRVAGLP